MNLPMLLGVVIMAIVSGFLITLIGYYAPFMIMSSIVASIGMGLLSTLKTNSDSRIWIGYECLFGLGIGAGLMQCVMIAQTVLNIDDSPTGTATLIFSQTLGGAVMVSISPWQLARGKIATTSRSESSCLTLASRTQAMLTISKDKRSTKRLPEPASGDSNHELPGPQPNPSDHT